MTPQQLATQYLEKVNNKMTEFLEESKGTKGQIFDDLAKKHLQSMERILSNYEKKLHDL